MQYRGHIWAISNPPCSFIYSGNTVYIDWESFDSIGKMNPLFRSNFFQSPLSPRGKYKIHLLWANTHVFAKLVRSILQKYEHSCSIVSRSQCKKMSSKSLYCWKSNPLNRIHARISDPRVGRIPINSIIYTDSTEQRKYQCSSGEDSLLQGQLLTSF